MTKILVVTGFALAAIWLYGRIIISMDPSSQRRRKAVQRFRWGGVMLLICAIMVGSLYRFHVISLMVALALYIPLMVAFVLALRWLQPYLRSG